MFAEILFVVVARDQNHFELAFVQVDISVEITQQGQHRVAWRAPVRRKEQADVFGALVKLCSDFFVLSGGLALPLCSSLFGEEFVYNHLVQLRVEHVHWWLQEQALGQGYAKVCGWLHVVGMHEGSHLLFVFLCHFKLKISNYFIISFCITAQTLRF